MLRISEAQIRRFADQKLADFSKRAVTHLRSFDPNGFGNLDPEEQEAMVDRLYQNALALGIHAETEVILFAKLSCILKEGFMQDPSHEWYSEQLSNPSCDQGRTLEYLLDVAIENHPTDF